MELIRFSIIQICDNIDSLQRSIESLLKQSLEDWESIIVFRGEELHQQFVTSTPLLKNDKRFKLIIVNKDENIGKAWNIALKEIRSLYAIFLQNGNTFTNETILSEIASKTQPRHELTHTSINIINEKGNPLYTFKHPNQISIPYLLKSYKTVDIDCFIFSYEFLKKRQFNENLRWFTEWEFILRALSTTSVIQYSLNCPLVNSQAHPGNKTINYPTSITDDERYKVINSILSPELLNICQHHELYNNFYHKAIFRYSRRIGRTIKKTLSIKYWENVIYTKRIRSLICLLNKKVRIQESNPLSIPVIIINYNRLNDLKKLVSFLIERKHSNIIILDNCSTYPPLLEYYEEIKEKVDVRIMDYNYGHLVLWKNEELYSQISDGYYIVTDFDIIPNPNLPVNYVEYMMNLLYKYKTVTKVGFALRIDDVPKTREAGILPWEEPFWNNPLEKDVYSAAVDTTFALYAPKYKFSFSDFYNALRIGGDFTARHGGYYILDDNPSDEDIYYFNTSNSSSTWKGYAKIESTESDNIHNEK